MPLAAQEIDASHLQMLQRAQKVFRNESMGSKDELKKYEAQLADTMADILQRLHAGVLQCVACCSVCCVLKCVLQYVWQCVAQRVHGIQR